MTILERMNNILLYYGSYIDEVRGYHHWKLDNGLDCYLSKEGLITFVEMKNAVGVVERTSRRIDLNKEDNFLLLKYVTGYNYNLTKLDGLTI